MLNIIVHFSRIEKSVDAENFCQGIRVEIKTKIKKKKKRYFSAWWKMAPKTSIQLFYLVCNFPVVQLMLNMFFVFQISSKMINHRHLKFHLDCHDQRLIFKKSAQSALRCEFILTKERTFTDQLQ